MVYAQTKQTTLIVDRGQAKAQLQLLGYQPGDSVYMRFFVPDTDPRYGTPEAARKANKLDWAEVERYQNDGYGVYFVINGGGHADKDVKVGRALFCEWDDRPIEDQTFAWQGLNLLEPSMQVSTRKSVHNYWRADLTKEQWIELQKDLLAYTQSDQKLKNPSRVLRLAGAYHIKPGCDPIRCDIIHQTERVYTYEELRSAIPRLQQPEQPAISYQPSISEDVPLYQFLTKDDRALIDQGAAQGSRNGSGAKLARNLIGTAARLNYLGIQFSGDSRQLFDGYCHRCNPPIASRESDAIWKSAQKNNPTASLTDEALENCAKAWLRNQEKVSGRGFTSGNGSNGGNRRNFGGGSGSGGGDGGDGNNRGFSKQQKLPLREAVQKAREILHADNDELTTNIQLEEIREACSMSGYDWERKIIKPLKRDLEGDRFKFELLGLLRIDDQVERIRQQALMAPKYQMSSSLIEKAMYAMKQRTQTPEAKALDLDELFDLESEGLSWVIPGLLPEKETIVLAGAPKAGKTLLAIDAAYAVVTGESHFLGEAVKQGKVLLVSADESANSTKAKLLNRGFRRCDKNSIKVLPTWDISQMVALEALLEDFRPNLVIIDSLRRINKGSEVSENSAEFADAIYTLKETLERYGAAGILIHHTNKDREALGVHRLRGSSAIAGAVWGTWQLDQIPKPDPNNKKKLIIDPKDPTRTLSVFARDIEGQQLVIELNPENCSWDKQGEVGDSEEAKAERDTLKRRILTLLAHPAYVQGLSGSKIIELFDDGEVNKHSVYNCLRQMTSKFVITCKNAANDKRYHIYSLPKKSPVPESDFSPPPPSPLPTVEGGDYYTETIGIYGVDNSHVDSHLLSSREVDENYSTPGLVGDSEIVITYPGLGGGGGGENSTTVTVLTVTVVEDAIAPAPWAEKYTYINVNDDGWGEIVRKEETQPEAIAPTPAHADTAEGENPVTPVEIELEAAELLTVGETPQTITVEPVEPVEASFDEEVAFLVVILADEAICPNRDELALYRRLYSPAALNAACKQLSPSRHAQILQWVIELNEAAAVTPKSEPLPTALPTSSEEEILTSGEAVGRLAHTRNTKGEVSSEAMRIAKWCDRNGFYTLANGDTAYPFQLVLAP